MRLSQLLMPLLLGITTIPAQSAAELARSSMTPRQILVLTTVTGDDERINSEADRLIAELRSMGHHTIESQLEQDHPTPSQQELPEFAREVEADTVIQLIRRGSEGSLALWLRSAETELYIERTVLLDNDDDSEDGQLALYVVDLLNAGLLELRLSGEPLPEEPPSAPAVPSGETSTPSNEPREDNRSEPSESRQPSPMTPTPSPQVSTPDVDEESSSEIPLRRRARPGRLWLGASMPINTIPGRIMAAVALGGGYRLIRKLVVDVDFLASVFPMLYGDHRGNSWSYYGTARASLTYEPWPEAVVNVGFSLGGGVVIAWTYGEAFEDHLAAEDVMVAGLVSIGARLALPLTAHSRLILSGNIGVTIPEIQVRFAGEPVAIFGRPLLDLTLSFEWGLGAVVDS